MRVKIEELKNYANKEIETSFLLEQVRESSNKNGTKWLTLTLSDSTGRFEAKIWNEHILEVYKTYSGKVVSLSGKVDCWNGVIGMAVVTMRLAEQSEYNIEDFVRVLPAELFESYKNHLRGTIYSVCDDGIRNLLLRIFGDGMIRTMGNLPAGLSMHHAFRGALLVHTLEVLDNALAAYDVNVKYANAKPFVAPISRDLVIAGALLHDIGKTVEYGFNGFTPIITKRGGLIGHIQEGCMMVMHYNSMLGENGVDDEKLDKLMHIVLASHYDKGPVMPKIKEAMIISQADMASACPDAFDTCVSNYMSAHGEVDTDFISCRFTGSHILV